MPDYEEQPRIEQLEQWGVDRATEQTPLPYSHVQHYENEVERQVDLAAAERSNIAHAAGELGITSVEWTNLRSELGRSPSRSDVTKR